MTNIISAAAIVIALGAGWFALSVTDGKAGPAGPQGPQGVQGVAGNDGRDGKDGKSANPSFGAAAGPDMYSYIQFHSGVTYDNAFSTTTPASLTIKASDIGNYDSVSIYPSVGDITVTLPASSTLASLLPKNGQIKKWCVYNATTTSGIDITFAGGTGLDLETASSSITGGAPALTLLADNSGCFEFQKKGGPSGAASRNDILVRFIRFVDGD